MKICAVTMVYRDYWALSQWYAHYGQALGHENLFIVAHGADPEIAGICPKASIIVVPRDDLNAFDTVREQFLNNFQRALAQSYDWIIRTDADELICLDPARYSSFPDLLSRQSAGAVFALGLDVFEFPEDDPLPADARVFMHRRRAVFNGHYSKAWAVRGKIALKRHGVGLRSKLVAGFPFQMPRGVYLAHLKYANAEAQAIADQTRRRVAATEGSAMPGKAWLNAEKTARKILKKTLQLPLLPWNDAEQQAWEESRTPNRFPEKGILRAKFIQFPFRTELPAWFAEPVTGGDPEPQRSD